jgi:hypothetical protein
MLAGLLVLTMTGLTMAGCGGAARRVDPAETEARPAPRSGDGEGRAGGSGPARPGFEASIVPASLPWFLRVPDVLTWTETNELALVDGESGVARQVMATAETSAARDLVYDPWMSRAVVFEGATSSRSAEVATYALDAGLLGFELSPRVHAHWVEGDGRLLSSPLGVVLFEQGAGDRWTTLYSDEESSASVAAPPPAGAWIESSGWDFTLRALTYGAHGQLNLRSSAVRWKGMSPPENTALDVGTSAASPGARMALAPRLGGALLFDVDGSDLAVRLVHGVKAGAATRIPLGAVGMRVEHAVTIDGGEVALLLLSGESRVLAIEMGAGGVVTGADVLSLPGETRVEPRFFSRDLALLGPRRALAATSAGVFAIRVERGPSGVSLTLDEDFDGKGLRGPLAPLTVEVF